MKITLPKITPGPWSVATPGNDLPPWQANHREIAPWVVASAAHKMDNGDITSFVEIFPADAKAISAVPALLQALADAEMRLAKIREMTWVCESAGTRGLSDYQRVEILSLARDAGSDAREALTEAGCTIE